MTNQKALQRLCGELDRFGVAAAVARADQGRLLVWNASFERTSTFSPEELAQLTLGRILVWDDPALATPPEQAGANPAEMGNAFLPCVLRPPEPARPIPAKSVQRSDGHTLILLDPLKNADSGTGLEVAARLLGRQEEARRARQLIHDDVSPELLAASFGAHSVNEKLKARQAPEAGEMTRLTETLDAAIQRLVAVFSTQPSGIVQA